ncbi:MAG: fatty acid--CoA ligase family protein [Acidimicrobiales bacterium]|jgi:acyl-coenzyme A synthetase/AMP-(fatty) acid ligase|nr:fatty acid--CoA ligase family protein [Acidimicrobiales bacterium]
MSLADLLLDHPCADDDPLVFSISESLTKSEVVDRARALSVELNRYQGGHKPVAVAAEGLDAIIAMFACWLLEAVFVPVNPRQPEESVRDAARRAQAASIIWGRRVEPRRPDTIYEPGVAFVLWTSGTTGEPKPVLHTHDAYLELIDRVLGSLRAAPAEPAKPPSPNLIPVSLALNAGIYNALFGLRAGAPLVLMDRFTTADFASLVERHQVRSTVLPPAAIAMLNEDPAIESLAPLRYVRSITAPLSPFHARRFTERFGSFVLNGYGQAEIGEVIGWTAADAQAHPDRIGAVGRAHAGVDIRVDEPDENHVGELLVRPPNKAIGLADDRVTTDGYVRTGDLARIDDAGFVWVEGRIGDLINRGGNKLFPDEVEEILLSVPGIEEAAVVGAPDDRLGEVPVAFVVGAPAADLDAICREYLAPYKVPVRFERLEALPRNAAGKLLRRELRNG